MEEKRALELEASETAPPEPVDRTPADEPAPVQAARPSSARLRRPGPLLRRWFPPLLLVALLATVVGINARYLELFPFPPSSQHQAFHLVPRHAHHFLGYLSPEHTRKLQLPENGHVLTERRPLPWTRLRELRRELESGGRLHLLVGQCESFYWTCMPHSFALLGAIAAAFPGRPTLVGLGITAYFLLLLAATYGIGREVRDRWTGLAAAAIAAGYPALFGYSRWIEGYLPVTALTVAMVWCLLRSRGLTRVWPTLGFCLFAFTAIRSGEGLSEAIGAGLTVAGPFLGELLWGLRYGPKEGSSRLRTLLGLLLVAVCLFVTTDRPWVINGLRQILGGLTDADVAARLSSGGEEAVPDPLIGYSLYLILIYTQYLKPVMVGWLLAALPLLLLRPVRRKLTLLLWFLIPLAAYSYMLRKAQWYALPIVPPLAVFTAAGLSTIRSDRMRATALTLAAATGIFQLVVFASPTLTHRLGVPDWIRHPYGMREINVRQAELLAPGDLPMFFLHRRIDQFLEYLDRAVPMSDGLKYIAVVTDWPKNPYEGQVFAYLLELSRPDFEVINLTEGQLDRPDAFSDLRLEDFAYFVRLRMEEFIPCCDSSGAVQVAAPGNMAPPPAPLWQFSSALLARSRGTVPGIPTVYALEHPDVPAP